MWQVNVRFVWGENTFNFPMKHEADEFQRAVLLCAECVLAHVPVRKAR